jgi:hypothetical protein
MIHPTLARRYAVHDHADHAELDATAAVPQRRATSPVGQRAAEVLALQRTAGNAAVAGMLQRAVDIGDVTSTVDTAGGAATPAGGGATGIEGITSQGGVVTIDAAMVNINAPMVRTDGVLQTDTLIAQSVVGSSYTPGAGNVM